MRERERERLRESRDTERFRVCECSFVHIVKFIIILQSSISKRERETISKKKRKNVNFSEKSVFAHL